MDVAATAVSSMLADPGMVPVIFLTTALAAAAVAWAMGRRIAAAGTPATPSLPPPQSVATLMRQRRSVFAKDFSGAAGPAAAPLSAPAAGSLCAQPAAPPLRAWDDGSGGLLRRRRGPPSPPTPMLSCLPPPRRRPRATQTPGKHAGGRHLGTQ